MVDRTWRAPNGWLVDEVLAEPGVACRVWDAEGLPLAEFVTVAESNDWLSTRGVDPLNLVEIPVDDAWCE